MNLKDTTRIVAVIGMAVAVVSVIIMAFTMHWLAGVMATVLFSCILAD